ncbi:MAG TPA: ferritin-like protein [Bryobacteraceae bacterium]|nr:ferritin-like protein [Bryobacteraceae bacterium]
MSYLLPPRLHFAGRFQADVSTVNNNPLNFDARTFRANFGTPSPGRGSWNPGGTGAWRLSECTVQRVVYRDGSTGDHHVTDPVVGAAIANAPDRVAGKIVDLDPQQQMVSEIWGFQIALAGNFAGRRFGFLSFFETAAFGDIWRRFPGGQPDSMFGAFYQSSLAVTEWQDGDSRFFRELSSGGETPKKLSIRFNVDGYDDDPASRTFTFGRITGSIGLYDSREPEHFISGRTLEAVAPAPFKSAYAKICEQTLHLDLGNSLATVSPGAAIANSGQLYAAILEPGRDPELLARIPSNEPDWYTNTSGIVSIPLTANQLASAAKAPLGVVQISDNNGTRQPVLREAGDGRFVRADRFVFRFNPGDRVTTKLFATIFGEPASRRAIRLKLDSSAALGKSNLAGTDDLPPIGVPSTALQFSEQLRTGDDGIAEIAIAATDPGRPRGYMDGQVYGITYGFDDAAFPAAPIMNPSRKLNALVFSGHPHLDEPTWLEDIQPIFQQYDNLFPVMRSVLELSNYASVIGRLGILRRVFTLPETDPNYMPVTRDMSRAKRDTIARWLYNPVFMRLDSRKDLFQALQLAVELEHATIPPYLCALYSIKEGTNPEVRDILRDIVMQEMVHMARVANILVALGGGPEIDNPAFVPRYPGPLPGGLRAGLTVRLRRCSIAQIRDVFMSMEQPETMVTSGPVVSHGGPVKPHLFTIGWFYDEIEKSLISLYESGEIQFGHLDRQVRDWPGPPKAAGGENLTVTNLAQARTALRTIKQQGESTSPFAPGAFGDEIGHYYRFLEIAEGRRIVVDPSGKTFTFTGDHIPFDANSVWPMIDDPGLDAYPAGSRASMLAKQFSSDYRALLKALHKTFQGYPQQLGDAIALMYSLNLSARELMQTPSGRNDGTTAGPVF